MPEALADPYFEGRGMIVEAADPLDGSVRAIGSPLHFSDVASGPTGAPAPLAGEHTRAILIHELGYDAPRIEALLASRAIAEQAPPRG
jgi:crotonobetainyl-CoA:carnitine CoA-transferase CaiB-like acyl-CoA transferase